MANKYQSAEESSPCQFRVPPGVLCRIQCGNKTCLLARSMPSFTIDHSLTPSLTHTLAHQHYNPLTHSLTHSLTRQIDIATPSVSPSITHPRTPSLVHALAHQHCNPLTHLLTHSLTHQLEPSSKQNNTPPESHTRTINTRSYGQEPKHTLFRGSECNRSSICTHVG